MDDATIRDNNNLLYTNPDNPYALPISILPEGGIYQRKDYRMLGVDFVPQHPGIIYLQKAYNQSFAGMEVNDLNACRIIFKDGECNIQWAKFHRTYMNFSRKVLSPVKIIMD